MSRHTENYPELLSLAVHEFRTPAGIVSGYLRMLQRDAAGPLNERQRKMVDEAERSCARLIALVAELSEVGKLDGGTVALRHDPFDLFTLAGEVAGSMHESPGREVRVEVRGTPAGAILAGDESRMRTTVSALLQAILREQVAETTIVMDRRLASDGGVSTAFIVIADSASVQTAYDTSRGDFDDKRGGMGLALPIAARVVAAHGGQLWSPQGDGTRRSVVLSFPVPELKI